jgi:hypothetical protein
VLSLAIGNRIGISRKTIATILAIVMFGVGHMYLGSIRRGIGILAVGIGLLLVAYPGYTSINSVLGLKLTEIPSISTIIVLSMMLVGLGLVGFWIWQIRDARKIAKQQAIEV